MPSAPLPPNESERLRALLEYDILDTPSEASFDRVTRMVSEFLEIPIVLVSLVDRHRQWFKSNFGLEVRETPRDGAFCAYTILGDQPLIVPDARTDRRFSDSPLVLGEPFVRFYAGVPLKSADGYNLGTLCAICRDPLHLAQPKVDQLLQFAAIIENELALRLSFKQLRENQERLLHTQKMAALGQFAARLAHEINTPVHFLGGTTDFLYESFVSLTTLLRAYESHRRTVCGISQPAGPDLWNPRSETVDTFDSRASKESLDALIREHDVEYLLEEVPVAIEQARSGILRITEVVTSMRKFVHPSSCPQSTADLNEAIRTTVVISGSEWRAHCSLDLKLDEGLPRITCRIGEINQALLNVIVNASHAIEERQLADCNHEGRIRIQTGVEGDRVCITLEDNGVGIPAEILSKVYDPLFTTKPAGKGTGQGLAIVHDILVNRHRGTIEIQSELGVGTVVRIGLPIFNEGWGEPPQGESDRA
jgi:two-component system NtrC family sensor kinase